MCSPTRRVRFVRSLVILGVWFVVGCEDGSADIDNRESDRTTPAILVTDYLLSAIALGDTSAYASALDPLFEYVFLPEDRAAAGLTAPESTWDRSREISGVWSTVQVTRSIVMELTLDGPFESVAGEPLESNSVSRDPRSSEPGLVAENSHQRLSRFVEVRRVEYEPRSRLLKEFGLPAFVVDGDWPTGRKCVEELVRRIGPEFLQIYEQRGADGGGR